MDDIFGDAELVEATLLVDMTINELHYEKSAVVYAPPDVVKAWVAAGIAGIAAS